MPAPRGGGGYNRWNLQIAPYLGYTPTPRPTRAVSAKINSAWFCPDCSASRTGNNWFISEYAPNHQLVSNAGLGRRPVKMQGVMSPSQKVILMETSALGDPLNIPSDGRMKVDFLAGGYSPPATTQSTKDGDLGFRHPPVRSGSLTNCFCNMAFLDGRVEAVINSDARLRSQTELNRLFDPLSP